MGVQLFISDLHLSPEAPGVLAAFERFITGPARQADSLYILGDLFDYWAGDDALAEPFNAAVCAHLSALAGSGVAVFFLRGNRDFLVGGDFARASGLTLLDEPTIIEAAERRTLLLHGDTLCTDDVAYQTFRNTVRDPRWQAQFLAQDLAARERLIQGLRQTSEQEKQHKPAEIMDVNAAAVEAVMRAQGVEWLIHGHTHRPARHVLDIDGKPGERWVLADWCQAPAYLRCEGGQARSVAV
jgi:UDP-2,3-diacylglucosamine hydrolase